MYVCMYVCSVCDVRIGVVLLVEQLHLLDGGSEGGQDHHVPAAHGVVVLGSALSVHELHVHRQQLLVHLSRYTHRHRHSFIQSGLANFT